MYASRKITWHADEWNDSFALVLAFTDRVPQLSKRYEWSALDHVCGDTRIERIKLIATELRPRPDVQAALNRIVRRWFKSTLCDPSFVIPAAREAAEARMGEYRAQLDELGVWWSGQNPSPWEALYPIDATQAALEALALDPPQLRVVSQPTTAGQQVTPAILLLSANSD
jgi:hypothetical protein